MELYKRIATGIVTTGLGLGLVGCIGDTKDSTGVKTERPYIASVASFSETVSTATGDMNGDGRTDIVIVSRMGNKGEVYVLLNNGDGSYTFQTNAKQEQK